MEICEKKRRMRFWLVCALLVAALLSLICLNIGLGSIKASAADIVGILFGGEDADTLFNVIWKIRLPRIFEGILLGGALALSGFLLQTYFNNPIAGPYVLGISSGAKLMVAVATVLMIGSRKGVSSALLIVAAFAGAMLSMGLVMLMAHRESRSSRLIVGGVMIGYICAAITDFIVTFADDTSIVNLYSWSRGSFSGASWDDVGVMAIVVLSTAFIVFLLSKPVGAYQLGESYAQSMGVNIRAFRVVLVLLSSLLSACVTAFAGPISFVGIAVPHLVKALLKTSRPLLVIPTCFLGGAVFCLSCDLMARTVFSPLELSISSVTALFGAPVVIAVMLRKRTGE